MSWKWYICYVHFLRSCWKGDKETGERYLRIPEELLWFFNAFAWIGISTSRCKVLWLSFGRVMFLSTKLKSKMNKQNVVLRLASGRYCQAFSKRQSCFELLKICCSIRTQICCYYWIRDTCWWDVIHWFLEIIFFFINWRHTCVHFWV